MTGEYWKNSTTATPGKFGFSGQIPYPWQKHEKGNKIVIFQQVDTRVPVEIQMGQKVLNMAIELG